MKIITVTQAMHDNIDFKNLEKYTHKVAYLQHNTNITTEALAFFALDMTLQNKVASHSKLSESLAIKMLECACPKTMTALSKNMNIPNEIRQKAAKKATKNVVGGAQQNTCNDCFNSKKFQRDSQCMYSESVLRGKANAQ